MKYFCLLILIALSLGSCKKDATVTNNGLIGKWELTEYFMSPGDAGRWYPVDNPSKHTIEFKPDGSFISNDGAYNNAITYQQDSSKLVFFPVTPGGAHVNCYFSIEDNNQTLIISPEGCIEGCSNKYRAIKSNAGN